MAAQALHPAPPRMHPNENLLATLTPIHANMSHAVGPDSGSRARPRARSARTHQTTGCRAPRATCARRRRATPQGRSSRPRGTAAPTCRAAQASVGLHATRAPPPTPDRGARTCRISPVHVRRQTLHGSSASPIFVTVYEASQTGIARRSVRASSTSAAHTRMRRLVTGAGARARKARAAHRVRMRGWASGRGGTGARAHEGRRRASNLSRLCRGGAHGRVPSPIFRGGAGAAGGAPGD